MTVRSSPTVAVWPFLAGDLLLVALGFAIVQFSAVPFGPWQAVVAFLAVAMGAWLSVTPFILNHRARLRLLEAEGLSTALTRMDQLAQIQHQIAHATATWQNVQDSSAATVKAAEEISERMSAEAQSFFKFLKNADQTEKAHLKLEAEKLKRAENDWLHVLVHIFDHVHALRQAAARSERPALTAQLDQFQSACREAARRVGFSPFAATVSESFDPKIHQVMDGASPPDGAAPVRETIATGYTFQGRLLRRALVAVEDSGPDGGAPATPPDDSPTAADGVEPEPSEASGEKSGPMSGPGQDQPADAPRTASPAPDSEQSPESEDGDAQSSLKF